eukprot:3006441-Rhodomonas_salina.1
MLRPALTQDFAIPLGEHALHGRASGSQPVPLPSLSESVSRATLPYLSVCELCVDTWCCLCLRTRARVCARLSSSNVCGAKLGQSAVLRSGVCCQWSLCGAELEFECR